MLALLEDLLGGLSRYLEMNDRTGEKSSIFCPYHRDHHTRGGEAAFSFVYLGSVNGQSVTTERGLALADWLLTRQNQDGSWDESPGPWKGTTVFQLMALAGVVDVCGPDFLRERYALYEMAIEKAADWVARYINMRRVTTNYVASGAAGLALVNKIFPGRGWNKGAMRLARLAAGRINREGLIEGEGRGRRILKKIYIKPRGIDIGYGLEMTLSSLALYLQLIEDDEVNSVFHRALQAHIFFVYPDGSLDNSLGSRGYKWTIYGSKTTHGSQMSLAYGALRDPQMKRALKVTTECLRGYVKNGLLRNGPYLDSNTNTYCLYPTIMRACNLAFALKYFPETEIAQDLIPADKALWVKKFSSLNSLVVKRKPWMATISGYDNLTRYPTPKGHSTFYVPGGGSLTYLFHDDWGPVQAATQLEYQQLELLHVPKMTRETQSLTPRIVLRSESGMTNSAYTRKTKISYTQDQEITVVQIWGRFFSSEGKGEELKSHYRIEYIFSPDKLAKNYHITLHCSYSSMEIVEPILLQGETKYQVMEECLVFARKGKKLFLTAGSPFGCLSTLIIAKQISYPLPSLKGLPVICKWDKPDPGEYVASMDIEVK
jgi:hypothetical protein